MRPRLLDLFRGAGGAAMGYHRAGFDVVGVDIKPQPHYPFEFHQGDALDMLRFLDTAERFGRPFVAVHASPPCQAYSITRYAHKVQHPDLLDQTRDLLRATGLPYIIENVVGADMPGAVVCCGAKLCPVVHGDGEDAYGLVLKRHRQFESKVPLVGSDCLCRGSRYVGYKIAGVYGGGSRDRGHAENVRHGGYTPSKAIQERLMGIGWMTQKELNQAIPPAYTEFIGRQLLDFLAFSPPEGP